MWAKMWACGQNRGQILACQSPYVDCLGRKLKSTKGALMRIQNLGKPTIYTFGWAFAVNFVFWFWVNVIWIGSENANIFERITRGYSHPQGIATGIFVPIFVGLLTAAHVFAFSRLKARLASNQVLKVATLSGLVTAYFPVALLGIAGIMYVA